MHVVQFYTQLYTERCSRRPTPDGLSFQSIGSEEGLWLERDFEENEVLEVVKELEGDRSLGPDGFSLGFVQTCWEVIKKHIMAVFRDFHSKERFQKSLNAAFITLIPKKAGAEELKDFRPISLVGIVYKLISKVLANQLKNVLEKIISKSQNAYIKGR